MLPPFKVTTVFTQRGASHPELPALDSTGKVHGELPKLKTWIIILLRSLKSYTMSSQPVYKPEFKKLLNLVQMRDMGHDKQQNSN